MYSKPDVIIVEGHVIFRKCLISFLTNENIATVIGEASDVNGFTELLPHLKPDLVIMDIDLPNTNGIEATKKAMTLIPGIKIIAYSVFGNEEDYCIMTELGVKGFILKSNIISELEKTIRIVMMGTSNYSNEINRKTNHKLSGKKNSFNRSN
ncbi:MAG: response regulator transcription factor [Verrucomicrobiota bacterium]